MKDTDKILNNVGEFVAKELRKCNNEKFWGVVVLTTTFKNGDIVMIKIGQESTIPPETFMGVSSSDKGLGKGEGYEGNGRPA